MRGFGRPGYEVYARVRLKKILMMKVSRRGLPRRMSVALVLGRSIPCLGSYRLSKPQRRLGRYPRWRSMGSYHRPLRTVSGCSL